MRLDVPSHDVDMTDVLRSEGLSPNESVEEGTVRVIDIEHFKRTFPDCREVDNAAEIGAALFTAKDGEARVPLPRYGLNFF